MKKTKNKKQTSFVKLEGLMASVDSDRNRANRGDGHLQFSFISFGNIDETFVGSAGFAGIVSALVVLQIRTDGLNFSLSQISSVRNPDTKTTLT